MGIIYKLPEEVAIKIAAGEVVERPASVVKELVENALDAGAAQVSVFIDEGGKSRIEVRDNGSGMDRDDAVSAFLRHGTSKIRSVDDLAHVTTLGFRGEALAAIGSSGEVELITTRPTDTEGTHVAIRFGSEPKVKPHAPLAGTTIRVTHLFAELPVRQKFLKSDATEWKSCLDILMKQMLVHADVAFQITHNDREVYNLPAGQTLRHRAAHLWDIDPDMLVEVASEIPHLTLTGVVAKPEIAHSLKSRQFFSVNGHPINDKMLARSIKDAFGTLLPPTVYPTYALQLAIHPGVVDVNIHPRKDEVRFVNSQEVFRFVFQAVSQSLQGVNHAFASFQVSPATFPRAFEQQKGATQPLTSPNGQSFARTMHNSGQAAPWSPPVSRSSLEVFHQAMQVVGSETPRAPILAFDNCFLITQHEGKLLLVDQHAAHERILYDEFWHHDSQTSRSQQKLLVPSVVTLAPDEIAQRVFYNIVRGLGEERSEPELTTIKHRILATVACKAAVKAGDILTETEKQQLITDLLAAGDKFTCPHGRPSHIEISASELEKLFKRTGF